MTHCRVSHRAACPLAGKERERERERERESKRRREWWEREMEGNLCGSSESRFLNGGENVNDRNMTQVAI